MEGMLATLATSTSIWLGKLAYLWSAKRSDLYRAVEKSATAAANVAPEFRDNFCSASFVQLTLVPLAKRSVEAMSLETMEAEVAAAYGVSFAPPPSLPDSLGKSTQTLDVLTRAFVDTLERELLNSARWRSDVQAAIDGEASRRGRGALVDVPELDWADAARLMKDWMARGFGSRTESQARFSQIINVEDQSRSFRVRRSALAKEIRTKLAAKTDAPVIIVGEDGVGKTWALARAFADWSEAQDILLLAPARNLASGGLEDVLIDLLRSRSGQGNTDGWRHKLARWFPEANALSRDPRQLVLVIDGLNQNPGLDWKTLVLQSRADRWRGRVKLVLIARPRNAQPVLELLEWNDVAPETVKVAGFNDEELSQALALVGRSVLMHQLGGDDLERLLRTPRYFETAVRVWDDVEHGAPITASRLILEDLRSRFAVSNSDLTHDAWSRLLAAFGQRLLNEEDASFNAVEIEKTLAAAGMRQQIAAGVEEIRTGALFARDAAGDVAPEENLAELAIGMAVVEAMAKAKPATAEETRQKLDEWLPELGADARTRALRNAAIVSLCWTLGGVDPLPIRTGLLLAWLTAHNPTREEEAEASAYAGLDPDAYADAYEYLVHEVAPDRRAMGVLIKALTTAAAAPVGRDLVLARAKKWAGYVGLLESAVPDERARKFRVGYLTEMLGFEPEEGPAMVLGAPIQFAPNWDPEPLVELAAAILRREPVAPHIEVLRTAAVAAALARSNDGWRQLRWTTRLNNRDPDAADQAIRVAAQQVRGAWKDTETPETTAHLASYLLLDLISGDQEFAEMRTYVESGHGQWARLYADYEKDPIDSAVRIEPRHVAKVAGAKGAKFYPRLTRLKEYFADRSITFPEAYTIDLKEYVSATWNASTLSSTFDDSSADFTFETVDVALARVDPAYLAELKRAFCANVSGREGVALESGLRQVRQCLAVVDEDLVATFADMLKSRAEQTADEHERRTNRMLWDVSTTALDPLTMLATPFSNAVDGINADALGLIPPPSSDLALEFLNGVPPGKIAGALHVLYATHADAKGELRTRLQDIALAADTLKGAWAMGVLCNKPDPEFAHRMIDADWRWSPKRELANDFGSWMLLDAGLALATSNILDRLAPWFVPIAIRLRGANAEDVEAAAGIIRDGLFAEPEQNLDVAAELIVRERPAREPANISVGLGQSEDVRGRLELMLDANASADALQKTAKRARAQMFDAQGDGAVFYARPVSTKDLAPFAAHVETWAQLLLENARSLERACIVASGLVLAMIAVLLETNPPLAKRLWLAVGMRRPRTSNHDAYGANSAVTALFSAKDSPEKRELLREVWEMDDGGTDARIFDVVYAAERAGAVKQLLELVDADEQSGRPYRIARAIMARSFLTNAPLDDARRFVSNRTVTWLDGVRLAAADRARRNKDARHWYNAFLNAPGAEEAYAAWLLMLTVVDRRFNLWGEHEEAAATQLHGVRRAHRLLNFRHIQGAIEKNERKLGEHFLNQRL